MTAPQQRTGQAAQPANQRMTLRRFVSVTIDNFRQLLQTISAPTTSLPMPSLSLPPREEPAARPAAPTPVAPGPAAEGRGAPPPGAAARTGNAAAVETSIGEGAASDAVPDAERSTAAAADAAAEQAVAPETADALALAAPAPEAPVLEAPMSDAPMDDADADPPEGVIAAGDDPALDAQAVDDAAASHPRGDAAPSPALDEAGDDDDSGAQEAGQEDEPKGTEDAAPADWPPAAFPLAAALESLLFVSDAAVEPAQLARALDITPAAAEAALVDLDAAYRRESRGLRLQVRNGRYQLVTAPEAANLIEIFLNLDASARLSAPALETLAVVAYRQPVTRAQVEAVRGVDCSGVLRSLLQRGLLEEVGRLDAPGRPVLYGVTDLFMHHFGLTGLHELPPLENAEAIRLEETSA